MTETAVSAWFGDGFERLHPLLQDLHRHGGRLHGPVRIRIGRGVAGWVGRRLARKLGVPVDEGRAHTLKVSIHHTDGQLHWDRRFDDAHHFPSTFRPVGRWPDGYWVEDTSAIALLLQVEVIDGGWYWRCVGATRGPLRLPAWLLPRGDAYKRIEQGQYRFSVSFALPLLGELLAYEGLLDADTATS
ncbi:DUF4166 domain-containing protein [Dyella subtropica]|uniref:DUF4166 domain-containing protein n=1 Tax=Dyella subtropica TaxID=2992127 RepID=UPI00224D3C7B|nr:DUF4166 domain-containing protein [Dyella subtropica]